MTDREVHVRGDLMGRGHASKIGPVYRDEVLGPVAKRLDALPEGSEEDDAATDQANLRRLLKGLGGGLIEEMASDRVVESVAAAGVQASMLGRAAVPKVESSE